MDFSDDEPRKVPKPVSFAQNPLLNPIVPEVSFIFQDSEFVANPPKKDTHVDTEYQTYNAWKWKNTAPKEKPPKENSSCINLSDCSVLKDRFYMSDIEKRKNQILYGQSDEPRRPLPPRPSPVVPSFKAASFSDSSLKWQDDEDDVIVYKPSNKNKVKESANNYGDMDKIIENQNRQLGLLQKQIEQLLKSQEIKEKQIEQLLHSQELKENKIEQLLQVQAVKEKQIEQLLRSQEKKEKQIEQLIKTQEVKEKQKYDLVMQLKEKEKKQVKTVSVGTMTSIMVVDQSTNTSFECYCNKKEINEGNHMDKETSVSLNMGEIPTIQEPALTPQSSIHIDIHDYKDSSDDDSDDSTGSKIFETPVNTDSVPLGYTFYNNVLTQVKDILENSNEKENENPKRPESRSRRREPEAKSRRRDQTPQSRSPVLRENNGYKEPENENGALQQFHPWGVDEYEKPKSLPHDYLNQDYNATYQPQFEYNYVKEVQSPTDISLKMNALAIKYLKREQISQYSSQLQQAVPRQPDVTIYNVTNLSIGTMRYLERHRILPNTKPEQMKPVQDVYSPGKLLQKKKKLAAQDDYNSSVGNILDITAINQQPKLL